ncbi:PAS domain-containing sensor histidine kinase [Flavobacterium johnsoniae]|uniref:histidine kinase n=1 Tax=Flavobacterium johnsoniae (strain ATCC 17061 / DSM 2064 / JCM 8514 / BCRC 14874 / CCUG 350202 / NBRC 14942 / NCIMB 11054 / UW101) TaxID=376686 RepID=A5FEZ5_FLAJ1|nr:PAS domain S-box protein [Flavobacterium johnsoniae]ABQ06219.1 PAS/PAC sensor signal transduction histidine kinase [Flavobacterium johnsoniae UW101]OXE98310.1 PAS domain-containing sensor histidine kinase [Flavobacterium johnsoniae UW101]WQG81965.1 PAS domain S-box protein [Flavobacterium johnsoniae UW101]SHK69206.1 PAS domain S-box-containing protein [Flavobacterium johnsoniae]
MELTSNDELFYTIFNSAANGLIALQPVYNKEKIEDFLLLFCNSRIQEYFEVEECKNQFFTDIFKLYDADILIEKFTETLVNRKNSTFEISFEIGEQLYWFRFTAEEKNGLLIVTVENITEYKTKRNNLIAALTAIEKQERFYNSITNTTPDLVYVFDLAYNFTYANKALLDMWGKSAQDAIGKGLRDNGYEEWHAVMHEREIDDVVANKKMIRGTVSFPHAELGRRVYDYIFAPVFNKQGEVEAIAGTTRDITEIKLAEEQQFLARKRIEESESRLQSMIHQTPSATLVLMGADLVIEQINRQMLALIGRGEEIIGMRLIDVLPELNGQYVWTQVQNVYNKGIPFDQAEVLVQHNRTGEMRDYYYNLAYRPLVQDGVITGMIQVAEDVTEQVTARNKMEESEKRFRALVNASSDFVYRMNADWTVMRSLETLDSYASEGEPVSNWINSYIHPDDRKKALKLISEAIDNKSIFQLEHRVLNANGTIGWNFSRVVPILDDNNTIIEWFGAASDITSQKEVQQIINESAENFRQLADLVPQIIWTSRPDGFIDYYNKRWYEYTNLKENEYGDSSWISVLHPDDVELVKDNWYESIQSGNFYQLEFRLKDSVTGEYRWFLSKAVPIRDASGAITKWFGTCTDIHEQKTATEKLEVLINERTRELQRSNEDLQQFAHVASHDLKEPVRKIKTFISRLEDNLEGKLDDSAKKFIDRIHVASDRMFNMIEGVLAYSKINADQQKPTVVDLNEVLKNIETDLEVSLQKTGGEIYYDNLPVLEGAQVLLYQLFYNLINNSIKFAKDDVPVKVKLSSKIIKQQDNDFAVITVEDNGIGFNENQAERIFETFTRLNSKDSYEGTGLGLSLCKKIVERHAGTITASGSPYNGAVFTIVLPLKQEENDI